MDIRNFLKEKSEELIKNASELKSVNIEWQSPIIINCSTLQPSGAMLFKNLYPDLFKGKSNPGVYYFKIINDIDSLTVIKALKTYKLQKERACPKIDNTRSKDSMYLYCGSRKVDLPGRFIQHLGYGSGQTYALQLVYWAKELGLQLDFNYGYLKVEQKHLTELVEASLAMAIKPLVGKLAT